MAINDHFCCVCNKQITRNEQTIGVFHFHYICAKKKKIETENDCISYYNREKLKKNYKEFFLESIKNQKYVNINNIFFEFQKIYDISDLSSIKRTIKRYSTVKLLEMGFEKRSKSQTAYMKND